MSLILIVDDEPEVRSLLREVLAAHGFRIVEAGDGGSALRLLQELGGAVGLVVSDYHMPGMDGARLARQVKRHFPGVPVLIVSGEAYANECAVADGLLPKPFAPDDLVEAVRRIARSDGTAAGGR